VYSGAVLHFFDAGTSNTRTVYSNYGLSTSLGTTVTCDSGGFPTSDGNSKVEIYTGSTPYKLTLKNSAGTTIWTLDNIKAALDTSSFLTDSDIVPSFPITNTSSNQALVAADKGKFYNVNCSGGDVAITFDDSPTLGNDWNVKVRHDGTANQVTFTADGSELFKIGSHAGVGAFAASKRGQTYTIVCDGTGFKVEETAPALFNTTGVITITDRTSTPPSAQAGERYIVGSAPTGAWSTYAEHDIAEYSGSGWFNITPPTNSGWVAWVDDEKRHYNHDSTNGWRLLVNGQAALEFITSGTISAASTLDISIPTDVEEIEVVLNNIIPGTDAQGLYMRFSQSASFLSGASDYKYNKVEHSSSASGFTGSAGAAQMLLAGALGSTAGEDLTLSVRIFKPNAAATPKRARWEGGYVASDAAIYQFTGYSQLAANSNAIDGVRFLMASGTLASGTYVVYGRRGS
jgi:hypothetical protein